MLLLALLLAASPGPMSVPETRVELSAELSLRAVTPRVLLVTHTSPWPSNSVVVDVTEGPLLLIDTPWTPAATELLLGWLERRFPGRKLVALSTHFHLEATGGNAALRARKIPLYGSEATIALVASRGPASRAALLKRLADRPRVEAELAAVPLVAPELGFPLALGLELALGQEKILVIFAGPGHSPDNVVVWLPRDKVLVAGGLVTGDEALGDAAEAELARWPAALATLSALPLEVVIPGHGEPGNRELLTHTLRLLQTQ